MTLNNRTNMIASDFIHGTAFLIGGFNLIGENVRVGADVSIGSFNEITGTKIGDNAKIGSYNELIGIRVGDKTIIKSKTELKKGTVIGNGSYIDSRVSTSGGDTCRIGNNVTLRYGSIIARNVIIEDDVFISPQVGFINIPFTEKEKKTTRIEEGVLIGFNATIHDGVTIAKGAIIGAKANVTKDITIPGTYVGNPARLIEPRSYSIKKGKNVRIERGAFIGVQPMAFKSDGTFKELNGGIEIGDNAWIGSGTRVMPGTERTTRIGANVRIAQLCNIGHDARIGDHSRLSSGVLMAGFATIGRKSFIGLGARIQNRIKVGHDTLIGQGANVVSDIPNNVIAYGNPCKVIRKRRKTMNYLIGRFT